VINRLFDLDIRVEAEDHLCRVLSAQFRPT
jgi:hypothetical protein